jgi:hypothetical protein
MNDQQQRAFRALTSTQHWTREDWFVAGWNAGNNAGRSQGQYIQYSDELRPRTPEEKSAYLEGIDEGKRRAIRDGLSQATATDAARDLLAERARQVLHEGWTPEHDDEHSGGEMADAAGVYALHAGGHDMQMSDGSPSAYWPWAKEWWKPSDRRRNLVKAGALILAEIERLDRAAERAPAAQGDQP